MAQAMNRREALALGLASAASMTLSGRRAAGDTAPSGAGADIVRAHDDALERRLGAQVLDPQSKWRGAFPDEWGLHHCTAASAFLKNAAAAYYHPQSKHHRDGTLQDRMKLAAEFLTRIQNAEGNIDLLSTNFNSPPDTGFVVHSVATAAKLARMNGDEAVLSLMRDFLLRAGRGLSKGGVHTPNHRWVVCEALAQINDLFPDKRHAERIDQWLAEGIDIDAEGQYTERSTTVYNPVVNTALVVMAEKLGRPELLEPVRKNLDAMAYLLHPNGEVVTEISRRQDLNTRGTMGGYWFALRWLAIRDRNGLYAAMLKPLEPGHVELPRLMEYPALSGELPADTPVPDDYEREYALHGITRIRRGKTSATLIHRGSSRWVSLQRGGAVVNAVRFASAFFGKGQFVPAEFERRDGVYLFRQELTGRYLQPVTDPELRPVTPETWGRAAARRLTTQVCRLVQEAKLREISGGFEISILARGTDNVPLAVEINLREGGELTGVDPAPKTAGAFLLGGGNAEYRMGGDVIRFGPGHCEHAYVQVRGAEGKMSGPSVYLTGFTPFEHTLVFAFEG